MEKFFVLHMDDKSLPGFFSGEKIYFGTKDDLLNFYLRARKLGISNTSLTNLFSFINAESDITLTQTYNGYRLGERAIVLGSKNVVMDKKQWTHLNIWKFDYNMKFDKCQTDIIWIRYKRKYYRCLKPNFCNLLYSGDIREKYMPIGHFWGQTGYFTQDGSWLKSSLYVIDKQFDTKEHLLQDIEKFDPETFDFTEVINEIFGDG